MALPTLVRVDYRMIHGQTVAKWFKYRPIKHVVLANDELLVDEFMADIYKMAAGEIPTDIVSLNDVKQTLDTIDDCNMLIFKDINDAFVAFSNGLKLPELNVGAVQSESNRKDVVQGVAISLDELDKLKQMAEKGVKVFFQPIPETAAVSLETIISKY